MKKYLVVVLAVVLLSNIKQPLNAIFTWLKLTSQMVMTFAIVVLKLRLIASVRFASRKNVQNGSANPNG